jgi:hypothetical protein
MPITTGDVLAFLRTHRFAVEASRGVGDAVQAAIVGIAVTDSLEIVFDTLATTRKARNLRASPRAAFVIGGWAAGDERTVQYEGIADEPTGTELDRVKTAYFAAWPDGLARASWPGLIYIRVRPTWMRYSDFNQNPPLIAEFGAHEIGVVPANER